jgi:hypothetical protein
MPESLIGRTLWRTTFLREHQIRFQIPHHSRPVATALQAACAEEVVCNDPHFAILRDGCSSCQFSVGPAWVRKLIRRKLERLAE